jgi:hypothetical protein
MAAAGSTARVANFIIILKLLTGKL